jgi:hypothetical protein
MQIQLSTQNQDLGIFPNSTAEVIAREEATKMGVTVYMRDPVTDAVLKEVKPTPGERDPRRAQAARQLDGPGRDRL